MWACMFVSMHILYAYRNALFFLSPENVHVGFQQVTGVEFNPAAYSSEKAVDAETQVGIFA